MDSNPDPWRLPYSNLPKVPEVRNLQDSPFFKAVFTITFGLALLFFLVSIYALFGPTHSADFFVPSAVYFYIFLWMSPIFAVTILWINVIMIVLYCVFFAALFYVGMRRWKGPAMDNPVIYYGAMGSFGLLMSLLITFIEMALGVQIGGTSITTGIEQHPYLAYSQLIYAPFVEELGFRILPLGLFSLFLVARTGGTLRDSLASFILPGLVRRKYGISLNKWDYTLIIATSVLFGIAHVYFGAWDPGKIVSAAFVGFILALGFVKFGIFVDIPIHWFFNGFSTAYFVYPPLYDSTLMALLWVLLSGALAFVFILIVLIERKRVRNVNTSIAP